MKRAGFTFLEVLIAMAILAMLSASLMPLMSGLAAADHQVRLRAESWRFVQVGLTALYLGDETGLKEIAEGAQFQFNLDSHSGIGGADWTVITVMPLDSTQVVVSTYIEP